MSSPSFHLDPCFPCNNRWGAKKTNTRYGGGRVQFRATIGAGNEIYCRPRRGASCLRPTAHAIRFFANHEPRLSGALPAHLLFGPEAGSRLQERREGVSLLQLVFLLQLILSLPHPSAFFLPVSESSFGHPPQTFVSFHLHCTATSSYLYLGDLLSKNHRFHTAALFDHQHLITTSLAT
jgi:hypothetical protein